MADRQACRLLCCRADMRTRGQIGCCEASAAARACPAREAVHVRHVKQCTQWRMLWTCVPSQDPGGGVHERQSKAVPACFGRAYDPERHAQAHIHTKHVNMHISNTYTHMCTFTKAPVGFCTCVHLCSCAIPAGRAHIQVGPLLGGRAAHPHSSGGLHHECVRAGSC